MCNGEPLYMREYSRRLFDSLPVADIRVLDEWEPTCLPSSSNYFSELSDCSLIRPDKLVIFRWNREYPSDLKFKLDMNDYCKVDEFEFVGHSHEKITVQVFEKIAEED